MPMQMQLDVRETVEKKQPRRASLGMQEAIKQQIN